MKKFKAVILTLLTSLSFFSVTGCSGADDKKDELITSITANEEVVNVKIGDSFLVSNYYTIQSSSTLSVAQKACKLTSSDENIVKINGRMAEAVDSGNAVITVTSQIDESKTCTINVVVARVFIDRELTMIPSEDDFSNEWDNETETGSFRTSSMLSSNYYYIKSINNLKWYVETDITVHQVGNNDRWPKVGIVARSFNSRNVETISAFFLNANIGKDDIKDENGNVIQEVGNNIVWDEFGVCEVAQGGHWAWESGITNAFARHHDYTWHSVRKITYETKFKLGVARDNGDFHIFIDSAYVGSYQLNNELSILYENGNYLPSHVGFFHFNSDVTFSNYLASTTIPTAIESRIPATPYYTEFLPD